jgi:hypothetical protein
MTTMIQWPALAMMDKNVLRPGFYSSSATTHPGYYSNVMVSASHNWMQLDATVNYKNIVSVKNVSYDLTSENKYHAKTITDSKDNADEVWVVQPKWETPFLNFYNTTPSVPSVGSGSVAKGMWHQYGEIPTNENGIWFGIGDIPSTPISASDAYGGIQIFNKRNFENVLDLNHTNAQINLYIRNCWLLGETKMTITDQVNIIVGLAVPGGLGGDVLFNVSASNYQTATNIAQAINASSKTNYFLTASAFRLPADKVEFFQTKFSDQQLTDCGMLSGGIDPAGVNIKIINIDGSGVSYPNYAGVGALGNKFLMRVTGSFPQSPVCLGGAAGDAVAEITELMMVEGIDSDGNPTYSDMEYFHGGKTNRFKVKSLADKVGFDKTPKRLGEMQKSKVVKEAVVAIPYLEENGQKKFFNFDRKTLNNILSGVDVEKVGPSLKDMVGKLGTYVFPPKFDFLKYEQIKPFVMYIFEFEYKFSQKDLQNIWQNLYPATAKDSFSTSESSISHKLLETELLSGVKSNLKWIVFKVKQKAEWNYYKKTADSQDDDRFRFNFNVGGRKSDKKTSPDYSYNWPYDFFSIVEFAKMEMELEMKEKKK